MAKRKRSSSGTKETEEILGAKGEVSHQGRTGGRLPRRIGTKDELKRAHERPSDATRVTKSTEEEG